jgi:hypothetical protein
LVPRQARTSKPQSQKSDLLTATPVFFGHT